MQKGKGQEDEEEEDLKKNTVAVGRAPTLLQPWTGGQEHTILKVAAASASSLIFKVR